MSATDANDAQAAATLARWLDTPADGDVELRYGEAVAGLDADVVEAVLALRPERAPPHRVTIDDVLDSITTGPFADGETWGEEPPPTAEERAAATALAGWLDGTDDGDVDLEDDVAEAIYALRPAMAPAPRLDLDAMLNEVQEGPLAAVPPVAQAGALVSLADERRRRMPRWVLPAVGAVAMAATTLFFVVPVADEAMDAGSVLQEVGDFDDFNAADARPQAKRSPAQNSADQQPARKNKRAAKKRSAPKARQAGASADTAVPTVRKAARPSASTRTQAPRPASAPVPMDAEASVPSTGSPKADADPAGGEAAPAKERAKDRTTDTTAPAAGRGSASGPALAQGTTAPEAKRAEARAEKPYRAYDGDDFAPEPEPQEQLAYGAALTDEGGVQETEPATMADATVAPSGAVPAAIDMPAADAASAGWDSTPTGKAEVAAGLEEVTTEEEDGAELEALGYQSDRRDRNTRSSPRRAASEAPAAPPAEPPAPLPPPPPAVGPSPSELAEIWRRADAAQSAGNTVELVRLLQPLIHHPDDDVAVDAAVRLGEEALRRGATDEARTWTAMVGQRSPGTIQRARLGSLVVALNEATQPTMLRAAEPSVTNTMDYE